MSRSFVSNLERGLSRSTDISRFEAVCVALGADLDVRVRWQGEGLDRLLDEGHATVVDRLAALLKLHGWQTSLEVTFNDYGDRGSIDVFAWRQETRSLLVVEVKSVIPDAQGTLAPLDRKVRVAPKLARERTLDPQSVSRLLVVADTSTNRRRIARFEALFGAALPDRGWTVRQWLSKPAGSISGLLFLLDFTGDGNSTRDGRPESCESTAKGSRNCRMTLWDDIRL